MKKKINPDYLIVNSKDQIYAFTKFLKWNIKEIIYVPSLRFKKRNAYNFQNKIFLPIDFYSVKKICQKLENLSCIYELKNFEIKNHPEAKNSKKHKKLIRFIRRIIKNNDGRNELKTPIFVGSTGSIIETLNHGIDAIHVMEDVAFEIYSKNLWPSIETYFIEEKIVRYKLIKKNNKFK